MNKFEIIILEQARNFLLNTDIKASKKIVYNLNKAQQGNDPKIFKKINDKIWEFRTKYNNIQYRILAFWDKRNSKNTLVLCSNGFIKKSK